MFMRVILFVFFVFSLAGCATGSKKQAAESKPIVPQKTYQQEYYSGDYDDALVSGDYSRQAQKTYSEKVVQLSPKQIQRALKNAGYYEGPIDGKIGPKTKAAIIKFQKANGLKADGIAGKRTSAELNRYLSR